MNALERLRAVGGVELVERLRALDELVATAVPLEVLPPPDPTATADFDVALVGGGLSLVYASLLAARGLRVGVFERFTAGVAHREWNASASELRALVTSGFCEPHELEALIVARYRDGFCRWYGGGTYRVREVLDVAVDAGALLALARSKALAAGARIYDGHRLVGLGCGVRAVRLAFAGERSQVVARVVVDARGAASQATHADLVCPTVGGVVRGLATGSADDEIDPQVGEILVTTEGVEDGRQHLWEAFPGRSGETTVYLFYYAARRHLAPGALSELYERFFRTLPSYKRGDAELVRPTFGVIPGWSRLGRAAPPQPRIVPVGDAAARHSPLTFCGFGATLRSLDRVSHAVLRVAEGARIDSAVDDRGIHRGTGALAMLLATPSRDPGRQNDLNELLDTAFASLAAMGEPAYRALLRDEMGRGDFIRFLRRTAQDRPRVYRDVFAQLGIGRVARWVLGLASA